MQWVLDKGAKIALRGRNTQSNLLGNVLDASAVVEDLKLTHRKGINYFEELCSMSQNVKTQRLCDLTVLLSGLSCASLSRNDQIQLNRFQKSDLLDYW